MKNFSKNNNINFLLFIIRYNDKIAYIIYI